MKNASTHGIADLRRRLGLTQARLARLAGVHPMTVSKWERGVLAPNPPQRAILGALEAAAGGGAASPEAEELAAWLNRAYIDVTEVSGMKLSASNQFRGRVVELELGPVSARVVIEIAPRVRITSVITTASARRLGLRTGRRAVAIVKATEVLVGVPG
ncbi:MAG: TOBE domain-containing protein [Candidatus Brocadiae bacterium]|nr:TOBE domain-containing protein [Candidatus Brocadiia bacterium]